MTAQLERNLQSEILYRLNRYPVVAIPSVNGLCIPSRDDNSPLTKSSLVDSL